MESEAADTKILRGSIKSASYQMVIQVRHYPNPSNNISAEIIYSVFFQVFLRCISFVLNVFVLHNVDKALLGIVNVRLVLLIMSILFISRESFRKSCMNKTKDQNWPQVVNLLWLT